MSTSQHELLAQARNCLSELIDSAFLDMAEMANDCLEKFYTFQWEPKADLSEADSLLWSKLLEQGNTQNLSESDLSTFLGLTGEHGQNHVYYYRVQAQQLVYAIQGKEQERALKVVPSKASIEKSSKAAAANCLFDLESGERNAEIKAVLSPDAIFDAVQLSSSLIINVDETEYELEPYWPYLSEDGALEILGDVCMAIESELLSQYVALVD